MEHYISEKVKLTKKLNSFYNLNFEIFIFEKQNSFPNVSSSITVHIFALHCHEVNGKEKNHEMRRIRGVGGSIQ